ncbi:M23 family metallopeptidase [Salidesulfovibrio brasiliensis]|uniref:M23 family metallopeptidase n=1 Tax=Salidesulfovibrio brasiliensis TaxID=221711 RepID=UPI0006CFDDAE|nr:M23 family metallopeptidase [Salidesulfovibrio brasiliensis]
MKVFSAILFFAVLLGPLSASALELALPLYAGASDPVLVEMVDLDPRPGSCDANGGELARDGSRYTALMLPERLVHHGVYVLAAAAGRVSRVGMTDSGAVSVSIMHDNNWQTTYAGIAPDSLSVSVGNTVEQGAPLGLLAHGRKGIHSALQFMVTRAGRAYCPFSGVPEGGGCGSRGVPMWTMRAELAMAYRSEAVVDAGFGFNSPAGVVFPAPPFAFPAQSDPVFCATVMGARSGDIMHLSIHSGHSPVATRKIVIQHEKKITSECLAVPARSGLSKSFRGEMRLERERDGMRATVLKASASGSWR